MDEVRSGGIGGSNPEIPGFLDDYRPKLHCFSIKMDGNIENYHVFSIITVQLSFDHILNNQQTDNPASNHLFKCRRHKSFVSTNDRIS